MVALAGMASATIVVDQNWSVSAPAGVIPDDNSAGMTVSQTFSGLGSSTINGVDVRLSISGGYNGDLYGYLVLQTTGGSATAILLNRVGTSGSDPFGSAGSGFGNGGYVTLSDSGADSIHGATGNPTGTWQADQAGTLADTFQGLTANGTWTLFLADLSAGGGQSTLLGWGLDVSVVPEPVTHALMLFGGAMVLLILGCRLSALEQWPSFADGVCGLARVLTKKVLAWWRGVQAWVDAV